MYKVEVDKTKKLVKVSASGFLKTDEVNTLLEEVKTALRQFKPKDFVVLANLVGFKPASPDVLPVLQTLQSECAATSKKMAAIHEGAMAQMQMKRIGEGTNSNSNISRFATEEEALKYLLG